MGRGGKREERGRGAKRRAEGIGRRGEKGGERQRVVRVGREGAKCRDRGGGGKESKALDRFYWFVNIPLPHTEVHIPETFLLFQNLLVLGP